MNGLTVTLPWPSADLSPNSRNKWAMIRATKAAKHYACYMTKSLMGPLRIVSGSWVGPIAVHTCYHPPANYRFDDDGLNSRMKAAWDGIAMALGIDDNLFRHTYQRGDKQPPHGCVIVTLTPASIKGAGK
jgi:crossover junction endodeoxyribonuclease RusA